MSETDGNGNVSTTAYAPATGRPATGRPATVTETNALGQTEVTTLDPDRQQPTAVTDANNRTTAAWGDQYAYRREPGGRLAPEVHFLEGNFLRSEVIAGSFEEFLADELLRNAKEPYDELTVEAVERYGPIAADQHWAFVPSLAMDGTEDIGQVMQLPAVTAMVYAGDIATAVGAAAPDDLLTGVAPWTDDQGRARLRVLSVGLS